MLPTYAVSVRYPHAHALADSWDVVAGTLAVSTEAPVPGAPVVIDGQVGEVCFLLGGHVVDAGLVVIDPEGRPLVESLLEPPAGPAAGQPRAVA